MPPDREGLSARKTLQEFRVLCQARGIVAAVLLPVFIEIIFDHAAHVLPAPNPGITQVGDELHLAAGWRVGDDEVAAPDGAADAAVATHPQSGFAIVAGNE